MSDGRSVKRRWRVAPVARLYLAYFLRPPDYAGLRFWTARSRAGSDPAKVKQMIESLVDYLESIQARLVH